MGQSVDHEAQQRQPSTSSKEALQHLNGEGTTRAPPARTATRVSSVETKTRPLTVRVTTCTYTDYLETGKIMSFQETMKTTGASKRVTSQNQAATAVRDAKKMGRSGQNANVTPSGMSPEAVANGSGQMEIAAMHGSNDRDTAVM